MDIIGCALGKSECNFLYSFLYNLLDKYSYRHQSIRYYKQDRSAAH